MGLLEILKGEQPGPIRTWLNYKNPGQFGEYSTEFALTNHNLKGNFVVLKNIYLPMQDKTTEIDLLMIHEKGIFVFESKNFSGWIYGNAEELNWTQVLKGRKKFKFYNPIRQNNTHIQALSDFLEKPLSEFTSYIVFSQRCTLSKVPENTEKVVIVRRPDMLKKIRKTLEETEIIYTKSEIQAMEEKLKAYTNKSDAEKQEHIENIKTKCPFCGSELVLRNGKYGQFWGCSTYPKCRFTRPEK